MASRLRVTRDSILFATGLLGVMHETLLNDADRIALLALFGGMMGLPAFLARDEKVVEQKVEAPAGKTDAEGT